jgi:hypothetical protein
MATLSNSLVLGPLFWECPHLRPLHFEMDKAHDIRDIPKM